MRHIDSGGAFDPKSRERFWDELWRTLEPDMARLKIEFELLADLVDAVPQIVRGGDDTGAAGEFDEHAGMIRLRFADRRGAMTMYAAKAGFHSVDQFDHQCQIGRQEGLKICWLPEARASTTYTWDGCKPVPLADRSSSTVGHVNANG